MPVAPIYAATFKSLLSFSGFSQAASGKSQVRIRSGQRLGVGESYRFVNRLSVSRDLLFLFAMALLRSDELQAAVFVLMVMPGHKILYPHTGAFKIDKAFVRVIRAVSYQSRPPSNYGPSPVFI